MIAYVINGTTSLAYHFDMLTQQKAVITSTDIASFPEFSIATLGSQIDIVYQDICWSRLHLYMGWHSQIVISLYHEVGKSQVLDHHGRCHGILSY